MATNTDRETNGCTFQWKIENISHCWLKAKERIVSPVFTAEGTEWSLWLFPMGCKTENYISIFLNRIVPSSGPDVITVNWQLSVLDKNDLILKERTGCKQSFKKPDCWGFRKFETRERVFVTERERFLSEDTLTIQCMLSKTENRLVKSKRFFARTIFKVNRSSLLWKINEFSSLKSGIRNEFQEDLLKFELVFDGLDIEQKFVLNADSVDKRIKYFSFKTSIIDSSGKKEDCGTHEYFDVDLKRGVLSTLVIARKVLENKNRYLLNDTLSLFCEYAFSTGTILFELGGCDIILPTVENGIVEKRKIYSEKEKFQLSPVLTNDMKSMYNDRLFSDTELRTSTQIFPAHRNVLSARSPVFKRMFSNEMREKISGHVYITDLEDDTVHQMLLYMYTDTLQNMKFENALKLYVAADKYEILSLRRKCSSFLKHNMSPTKTCDALVLADLHQDDDLKAAVQDYIFDHDKEVFGSKEWTQFMDSNARLAAYVMYRKVFP